VQASVSKHHVFRGYSALVLEHSRQTGAQRAQTRPVSRHRAPLAIPLASGRGARIRSELVCLCLQCLYLHTVSVAVLAAFAVWDAGRATGVLGAGSGPLHGASSTQTQATPAPLSACCWTRHPLQPTCGTAWWSIGLPQPAWEGIKAAKEEINDDLNRREVHPS
jgi:hypothetical protein